MSDLKAIQARSLEMAEYFVAFCKKHDLLCMMWWCVMRMGAT